MPKPAKPSLSQNEVEVLKFNIPSINPLAADDNKYIKYYLLLNIKELFKIKCCLLHLRLAHSGLLHVLYLTRSMF